ncbi:chorismate mutase [Streptococcus gallolyticus]|uniref:Chorismate mutase n=1 Tax=Streptococcus gallolyticus TaxID=315405 RepID=A0A1H9PF18_9STRE|nr:chorismate mutase [Streptococcus gallolyticus]SER46727.1 chorismate mutase [Streptococcus gallolyticus]
MRDLAAVRQEIDKIDEHLITYLAKRQRLVEEAGLLKPKNDTQAVNAQERVEEVIRNYCERARAENLSPRVAEAIWRTMIGAFIALETEVNSQSKK